MPRLRRGQILFTYLHLAADRSMAEALSQSGATAIAYETVQRRDGSLPLLDADERGGRAHGDPGRRELPAEAQGGRGVLLGGVPGVRPATSWSSAAASSARTRRGWPSGWRRRHRARHEPRAPARSSTTSSRGRVVTLATRTALDRRASTCCSADLVIGAVLVAGARGAEARHARHGAT